MYIYNSQYTFALASCRTLKTATVVSVCLCAALLCLVQWEIRGLVSWVGLYFVHISMFYLWGENYRILFGWVKQNGHRMSCSGLRSASPWFNYRPTDGPFCIMFSVIFFCIPQRILWGERIGEDEICGACATYCENRNAYRVLVRKTEDNKLVGRPRRRWENNIKMYLKWDRRSWSVFVWFRIPTSVNMVDHPSGSIKYGEFVDWWRNSAARRCLPYHFPCHFPCHSTLNRPLNATVVR
jgi:hypothetical protein